MKPAYPTCSVCRGPMKLGQPGRHYLCDDRSIVGRRCVCRPKCSDRHVGDSGYCATRCDVCRIRRGEPIGKARS